VLRPADDSASDDHAAVDRAAHDRAAIDGAVLRPAGWAGTAAPAGHAVGGVASGGRVALTKAQPSGEN